MRMSRKAHSTTRRMPCVITVISEEPGQRLSLTNRRASRRRVWSVLMSRSARMFGQSKGRRPTRGQIFTRPGRNLTLRNNFWQISTTRLPRPLISPVAENTSICIHTPGLRVRDWALSVAERHGTPSEQYPGVQQRDPDSRIGRGYRTQPWDKAIRHSEGRSPHQPEPFTRGRGTRRETAQLTMAARQRRNGRARRTTKPLLASL